ncbi:MAG: hypothetical protein PHF87_02475 [Desulfotomaculaceae bacterium]|nr:hypothetical protein [Desulfotomaculaceae bacterium]
MLYKKSEAMFCKNSNNFFISSYTDAPVIHHINTILQFGTIEAEGKVSMPIVSLPGKSICR